MPYRKNLKAMMGFPHNALTVVIGACLLLIEIFRPQKEEDDYPAEVRIGHHLCIILA